MRRIAFVAAAFAVVAVVTPVGASVDDVGGGFGCGFNGTQPTGSPVVAGETFGGPWYAPPTHPDATVQIRCVVQTVENNEPPQVVGQAETAPTPGYAYLPPTPVNFPMSPTATIEVCTEVTVYWDSVPHYYFGDADGNPANGAQCDQAWQDQDQAGHVYIVLPELGGGDYCAYVNHPFYPPVPRNYCLPV
jgi:hypothetical protein